MLRTCAQIGRGISQLDTILKQQQWKQAWRQKCEKHTISPAAKKKNMLGNFPDPTSPCKGLSQVGWSKFTELDAFNWGLNLFNGGLPTNPLVWHVKGFMHHGAHLHRFFVWDLKTLEVRNQHVMSWKAAESFPSGSKLMTISLTTCPQVNFWGWLGKCDSTNPKHPKAITTSTVVIWYPTQKMHYFLAKIIQKLPYIVQSVNLPPKWVPFNDPFLVNVNHNKKHESTTWGPPGPNWHRFNQRWCGKSHRPIYG